MLGVVYVWEEPIDARFELRLGLGKGAEELVIEEHKVHNAVVGDQGFLQVGEEVDDAGKAKDVFVGCGLGFDYF